MSIFDNVVFIQNQACGSASSTRRDSRSSRRRRGSFPTTQGAGSISRPSHGILRSPHPSNERATSIKQVRVGQRSTSYATRRDGGSSFFRPSQIIWKWGLVRSSRTLWRCIRRLYDGHQPSYDFGCRKAAVETTEARSTGREQQERNIVARLSFRLRC